MLTFSLQRLLKETFLSFVINGCETFDLRIVHFSPCHFAEEVFVTSEAAELAAKFIYVGEL
jgi:hypothetical protein